MSLGAVRPASSAASASRTWPAGRVKPRREPPGDRRPARRPSLRGVWSRGRVDEPGGSWRDGLPESLADSRTAELLEDATLAVYLAELHDQGRAPASAATAVAAACFRARLAGEPSPAGERTARVLAGVERVTAHSGRVGLASELTSRGASTTDVMLAGNWKTSRMVAHYSAGATAERGAVARYL